MQWFPSSGSRPSSAEAAPATAKEGRLSDSASLTNESQVPSGVSELVAQANEASNFLKALGHDGRLTILCHLLDGPKSVTELEKALFARQAVVSQQLARLRLEGLVSARREGQAIYYSILDPKVVEVLAVLAKIFCKPA